MKRSLLKHLTVAVSGATAALFLLYLNSLPAFTNAFLPLASPAGFDRLFSCDITHHITVNITKSEWNGLILDMKSYEAVNERMKTQNYRRADFIYEDEYGSIKLTDVGFRTRGNTTRIIPEDDNGKFHRAHFSIRFNETFNSDKDSSEYNKLRDREFCGLEKLDLKWNLWMDASHIRELYCYEQLNAAGVPAPRASLSTLTINIDGKKTYFGVYTIIEPIDKNFLTRRFGRRNNDGNLYKCLWENTCATLDDDYPEGSIGVKDWKRNYRPAYDLKTNKNTEDTSDLELFIASINRPGDRDFMTYIKNNFDADGFIRLLAMNTLLGSCDDYRTMGNNYYLYFSNRGKVYMIPYDYDTSLGGGWGGEPYWTYAGIADADIYDWFDLSSVFLGEEVSRPLLDRMLKEKEFRAGYEFYIQNFIDRDIFSYESFLKLFYKMKGLYNNCVCSETEDRGEEMKLTNEGWYFDTKTTSVKRQLDAIPH